MMNGFKEVIDIPPLSWIFRNKGDDWRILTERRKIVLEENNVFAGGYWTHIALNPNFLRDGSVFWRDRHRICRQWLHEVEKRSLEKLRRDVTTSCSRSECMEMVTLVQYSFYPDGCFNEFPILHTWRMCGFLPTTVVVDRVSDSIRRFQARYGDYVSIQQSKCLRAGDITSLSQDCICNLHRYFKTP